MGRDSDVMNFTTEPLLRGVLTSRHAKARASTGRLPSPAADARPERAIQVIEVSFASSKLESDLVSGRRDEQDATAQALAEYFVGHDDLNCRIAIHQQPVLLLLYYCGVLTTTGQSRHDLLDESSHRVFV